MTAQTLEVTPSQTLEVAPLDGESQTDCWAPLKRFALEHRRINPSDFMCMGRITSSESRPVCLYKHYNTRRYLNIDTLGNIWAYEAEKDKYILDSMAVETRINYVLS